MYVVSETMVDLIKLIILVAFFVGTFLYFSTFNFLVYTQNEERAALDLLNSFLNSRCVLYQDEGGNYHRGIIDLEKAKEDGDCLDISKNYVKISDSIDSWESGTKSTNSFSVPVTVYHTDTETFEFGKLEVGYEKGSTAG